jgi:hypothetical protein
MSLSGLAVFSVDICKAVPCLGNKKFSTKGLKIAKTALKSWGGSVEMFDPNTTGFAHFLRPERNSGP